MTDLMDRVRALGWASLLTGLLTACCGSLAAQPASAPAPRRSILVIHAVRSELPGVQQFEAAFRRELSASQGPFEVYTEYADFTRFPVARYGDGYAAYLRERYRDRPPDLIAVTLDSGLDFILRHRDLYPGVPIVFAAVDNSFLSGQPLPDGVFGLTAGYDYRGTVNLIRTLQPEVSEIVAVHGTSAFDMRLAAEAAVVLKDLPSSIKVRWISGPPIGEVSAELANLPARSAVFYISFEQDSFGNSYVAHRSAEELCRAANAPMYGMGERHLEFGLVGGGMHSFAEDGRRSARLARQILDGQPVSSGLAVQPPDPLLVNWKALQRWGLPPSRIPAGAEVRHREKDLWSEYGGLLVGGGGAILLQAFLISVLLRQRDRLRKAQAVVDERLRFEQLAVEAGNLGFFSWDLARDEIWATERCRGFFGFSADESLDLGKFLGAVHPDDRDATARAIDRALKDRTPYAAEYRVLLPGQGIRWIGARGHGIVAEDGKPKRLVGVCLDVSAAKSSEFQLQRQRDEMARLGRMTMLGELAASLAHELNQPLAAMITNASAAQRFLDRGNMPPAKMRAILDDIMADGLRAGEVIAGIRRMVRREEGKRQEVGLNDLVRHLLRLTHADCVTRNCSIVTELAEDLPRVEADPVQLTQVLLNLVLNALDAMGEAPVELRKLVIGTQAMEATGQARAVRLSIRDHGPGLAESESARLFEPFYTTKPDGLGMGLCIARSIIELHGGELRLQAAPGGGALATVVLPARMPPAVEVALQD